MGIVASNKNLVVSYTKSRRLIPFITLNNRISVAIQRELMTRRVVFKNDRLLKHAFFQPNYNFLLLQSSNGSIRSNFCNEFSPFKLTDFKYFANLYCTFEKNTVNSTVVNRLRLVGDATLSGLSELKGNFYFDYVQILELSTFNDELPEIRINHLDKLSVSHSSLKTIPVKVNAIKVIELHECCLDFLEYIKERQFDSLQLTKLKMPEGVVKIPFLESLVVDSCSVAIWTETLRCLEIKSTDFSNYVAGFVTAQKRLIKISLENVKFNLQHNCELSNCLKEFRIYGVQKEPRNLTWKLDKLNIRVLIVPDLILKNLKNILKPGMKQVRVLGLHYLHEECRKLTLFNLDGAKLFSEMPKVFTNIEKAFVVKEMKLIEYLPESAKIVFVAENCRCNFLKSEFKQES